MILGVDVGGTFTDVVAWDGASLLSAKVSTTPEQSDGVVRGAGAVAERPAEALLHGTTIATNALLEGKGADTVLVASQGFTDIIEIGRQDRPSLYDPFADRPEPIVPRARRVGFPAPADLGDYLQLILEAVTDAEAVAVSLLYSFAEAGDEQRIKSFLEASRPQLAVSISSEVVAEFREFERTSTTVLNAYLTPVTADYMRSLIARCETEGIASNLAVMRSSGGLMSPDQATRLPAAALLSGPAGGVVAAAALGSLLGRSRIISFDMGGTSTDVSRIDDGKPEVSYERGVAGYRCRLPAVAIHTVGAGGGSIGWIDDGGSLRVGPKSAGARPGPACYARGGTSATVTDANVLLGRIDSRARLGGELPLQPEPAEDAITQLGGPLSMDAASTARGVVRVVEEVMAGAIRTVSIEQGIDPRGSTLVAYGGAGGLHATALARLLGMESVVIPPHTGVFSALGLLLSPSRVDAARTVLLRQPDEARLDRDVRAVAGQAREQLRTTTGSAPEGVTTQVDVRYVGQSHELVVPYQPSQGGEVLAERFHRLHAARNGFSRPQDPIEAVTVRAEATGRPPLRAVDLPSWEPRGEGRRRGRTVFTSRGTATADVWWRPGLEPGRELLGPAVVEEPDATTYLAPGERARVHDTGALEVEW